MRWIKFAIGFTFVLTTASFVGSWFLYERFDSERILREELQAENDELKNENNLLQSQLSQVKQNEDELERLRIQVKEHAEQRDALRRQLGEAESELSELRTKLQDLDSERIRLARQVPAGLVAESSRTQEIAQITQPKTIPVAVPVVKSAVADKKEDSQESDKQKSEKKEKGKAEGKQEKKEIRIESSKEQQMAPSPVVSSTPTSAFTAPPADTTLAPQQAEVQRPTQVLSVNRQFNFVVVNMGFRHRLKVGDILHVEEKGKLVGRIQVEKLYENFSACKIIEETQPTQIKEGDFVRLA